MQPVVTERFEQMATVAAQISTTYAIPYEEAMRQVMLAAAVTKQQAGTVPSWWIIPTFVLAFILGMGAELVILWLL